jgi:hypothetical protein
MLAEWAGTAVRGLLVVSLDLSCWLVDGLLTACPDSRRGRYQPSYT